MESTQIRSRIQGFGLLEMILVFILVIGAAAVVFVMFGSAKPSAEASNQSRELATLASNIQGTFGQYRDYTPLTNQRAINVHAVPPDMVADATNFIITNGWGGNINLSVALNKTQYKIVYDGIPADACAKFVNAAAGYFETVGSTNNGTDIRANGGPINATAVFDFCQNTPGNGANGTYKLWFVGD